MNELQNLKLISFFKNEFIIKVNQYNRLKIPLTRDSAMPSVLVNHSLSKTRNIIYVIKYNLASIINLLFIFFKGETQKIKGDIFLFTNIRHLKKSLFRQKKVRLGLYNFRYLNYAHIISCLGKREMFCICYQALFSYFDFKKNIRSYTQDINQDHIIFVKLLDLSFIRYLDVLLTINALEKNSKSKYFFSAHFEVYVAILSTLREDNKIFFLEGTQHGLYELPKSSLEYKKLYVDEYNLLFKESKKYFTSALNANKDSKLNIIPSNSLLNLVEYEKGSKKLIIFALQNDNYKLEKKILTKILIKYSDPENIVMCYLHPAVSGSLYKKFTDTFKSIVFEKVLRYSNVDVLYTRYSTIGIEYFYLKTTVYYILGDEKICISYDTDNKINFLEDIDEVN